MLLPNMSLPDEDTGMMDTLGQSQLEHLGLETPLQEIFNTETEHEIELHLGFIQHTDADKTTQECVTWTEKETMKYITWHLLFNDPTVD